jgi:hypothetical protein
VKKLLVGEVNPNFCILARHDGGMFLGEDLLAWIMLALGAALVVGNTAALIKPPQGERGETDLERAPVVRSVAMALLGLFAGLWALASLIFG